MLPSEPSSLIPGTRADMMSPRVRAHKPVDGGAAALVKWYVLAGAMILQVGLNLRANSHGGCPNCAHNGATLFRRQYSLLCA